MFFRFLLAGVVLFASTAPTVYAQVRPYRVTDRQLEVLIRKIEAQTDRFKSMADRDLDEGPMNGTRFEDGLMQYIGGFEDATDRLSANYMDWPRGDRDVREVLERASTINGFVNRNLLKSATVNQWRALRRNLDSLAYNYRTVWDWDDPRYGQQRYYNLTGTYRLDSSRSDEVALVIEKALSRLNLRGTERTRLRDNLLGRLSAPDTYVIQHDALRFTLGSSLSPQVTFDADGVSRYERSPRGVSCRMTTRYTDLDGLAISFTGDSMYDHQTSLVMQEDGRLRVQRRVHIPNRSEQVSVSWVYDRVSDQPQWVFSPQENPMWDNGGIRYGVNNEARLTAFLYHPVSTRTGAVGERFELEVMSPDAYRGAVITGRITALQHSGRVSGNASVAFRFESIRVRNGQVYAFDGLVDEVVMPGGKRVKVDNEGAVSADSQTKSTAVRAGIGAAVGAIVGAVAGGKKGAAVGALVGTGVGIGSVLLEGRDELELPPGTEFVITARTPREEWRYR